MSLLPTINLALRLPVLADPIEPYIDLATLQAAIVGSGFAGKASNTQTAGTDVINPAPFQVTTYRQAAVNTQAILPGFISYFYDNGPGDVTGTGHDIALFGWYQTGGAVNVALGIAAEGKLVHGSSGTLAAGVGVEANVSNTGAGNITILSPVHVTFTTNNGTVTQYRAIQIDDTTGLGGTISQKYSLFVADPNMAVAHKTGSTGSAVYRDAAGGILNVSTPVPTPDTALDVLCPGVIPAGTLKKNGDVVICRVAFNCAATANNKQMGLRVGTQSLLSSVAAHNGLVGYFEAQYVRIATDQQTLVIHGRVGTTMFGPSYFSTADDDGADINVWGLAQSAVAGEITCLYNSVEYIPAKN